jgi:hypothetical protein
MLRRAKKTVDPLSAQARTLAVTSKGDLETLKSDFQSDKAIKDGKIQTLEDDKNDKDTRMNTAETKITTLENSSTGIVDGGRADVQHLEATDINGGSASI